MGTWRPAMANPPQVQSQISAVQCSAQVLKTWGISGSPRTPLSIYWHSSLHWQHMWTNLGVQGKWAESTIPQPELVWITKLHTGLASSRSCSSPSFSLSFYYLLFCLLGDPQLRCTAPDVSARNFSIPSLCWRTSWTTPSLAVPSIVGRPFSNFAFQNSSFQESHSFWSCNARNQEEWMRKQVLIWR